MARATGPAFAAPRRPTPRRRIRQSRQGRPVYATMRPRQLAADEDAWHAPAMVVLWVCAVAAIAG
eukprot:1343334-Prymnesium_polylepis.1